jgi:hypothetical protein
MKGIEKEQDQMNAQKAKAEELYQRWRDDNDYLFTPAEAVLLILEYPQLEGQINSMSAPAAAAPEDDRTESEGPNYSGQ